MGLAELIAEKKRKAKESASRVPRKFMRKGEIEELENKGRRKSHEPEAKAPSAKASKSSRRESSGSAVGDEDDSEINLPLPEIVRRLRSRGEPIKLFGESLQETFSRLRKVELEAPLDVDAARQKNDFMAAMNQVEEDNDQHRIGEDGQSAAKKLKQKSKYTYNEIVALIKSDLGKGDSDRDQKVLRHYWKCLLVLREQDLEYRSVEEKESPDGKRATATFKQTVDMIKPLLQHFKKRDTNQDMVPMLVEIVVFMSEREYAKAADAYLRLAIGKAAWPIGVTNVGIHSRTGREKIFAQHIAHVLNDENSRKYIQAMKRMMSYAQIKFPTDPSKSLEYKAMVGTSLYPMGAGTL